MNIHGKSALVLGGVKGIGKAVALYLKRSGTRVAVTHWDWEADLPDLLRDLDAIDGEHLTIRCNLLDTGAISHLIDRVVDRFGGIHILINNIERGGWPLVHGPYVKDQWDLEMATTLRAKQWVFSEAFAHLKASGDAAVVNFSSISALVGRSGPASFIFNEGYAAASRGCGILTETWARMGAPTVRVNEIMLGIMDTRHGPGTRGWELLTLGERQALLEHTLLNRTGRIEDVVSAVRYLIEDANFMTGTILRLDGGYVLGADRTQPMPPGVDPPTRLAASTV